MVERSQKEGSTLVNCERIRHFYSHQVPPSFYRSNRFDITTFFYYSDFIPKEKIPDPSNVNLWLKVIGNLVVLAAIPLLTSVV